MARLLSLRYLSLSYSVSSLFYENFSRLCKPFSSSHIDCPAEEQRSSNLQSHLIPQPVDCLRFFYFCDNTKTLKQIHAFLVVHNLVEDESLITSLIKTYFRLGFSNYALRALRSIKSLSLSYQNAIVRCFSDCEYYSYLLMVYGEFQMSGCGSDNYTFPFVIKACAGLSSLQKGKEVHCAILRTGYGDNTVVLTALVYMYAKAGQIESARNVFDRIPVRDLVSWNALLSGYSMNGLDVEAFEVFQKIQLMGLKPNVSTFLGVITVFMLRSLAIGKSIHGYTVKYGIHLDESLVPAMISMYASFGDVFSAKMLFDLLPEKNVIAWNAMISSCTQNKKFYDAFEFFRLMQQENMKPNIITLVSVLPCGGNLSGICCGESVHAFGIKQGFEHQISIATALVSMYAKFGNLNAAEFLFHKMPEKNLLTWNSIISGYVQNGIYDVGLVACCQMQLRGLVPDLVSMVNVLTSCAQMRDLLLGKSAHAFSIRRGFDTSINVSNAILAVYNGCDEFSSCLKFFDAMEVKNLISWNTVLSSSFMKEDVAAAVAFFHRMQQEGVKFDLITMLSILPVFCREEGVEHGTSIHARAIKVAYDTDVSFVNALISMYGNCGNLEAARLIFDAMPLRTVVSWNALITGYRNCGLLDEVLFLFHQMKLEDEKPNSVTLLSLLPSCKTQLQVKSIHGYATRTRLLSETSLVTQFICIYNRFENIDSCCRFFYIADKRNTVVWNTMMSVLVHSKHTEKAVICFCEMLGMEIQLDSVTVLTLISACVQLGSMDIARCVLACIIQRGFQTDTFVENALIDMFAKCGDIPAAEQVFCEMNERDCVSWDTMINAYGMHGDGDAALMLFSQMKQAGVKPDDITFISILSACSHAGLVDQGRKMFNAMIEEDRIQPRMEHYACMVDLLGRKGHVFEAFSLIKSMKFSPSASMLESLLGACEIHGSVELGEEVGSLLLELEPQNCRSYLMLSNIYKSAGRWVDANRLRFDMMSRGITKVPGVSSVEVSCS